MIWKVGAGFPKGSCSNKKMERDDDSKKSNHDLSQLPGQRAMSPMEDLLVATRALRLNKLRSALTALGIVVGVAAVVCTVSLGAGARAEVSETIRTLGANLLLVMPGAKTNSSGA